jgi:hypothetical protein
MTTNENTTSDHTFGIEADGWDQNDLAPIIDQLNQAGELLYEIQNARRGYYYKPDFGDGDFTTLPELIEAVREMGNLLKESADAVSKRDFWSTR